VTVNKTPIIWFTGMSGSGKSTLANKLKKQLQDKGYRVQIFDGDTIRDSYTTQLGFGRKDVLTNNLNIAQKCLDLRSNCDVMLVPVISPYQEVRSKVRKRLEPNFHLIYLTTTLDNLKKRDTKGLYALADSGVIKDLIGFSKETPYEVPDDAELTIDTTDQKTITESTTQLVNYIKNNGKLLP
jgi:adenylyl-sulfate kinase